MRILRDSSILLIILSITALAGDDHEHGQGGHAHGSSAPAYQSAGADGTDSGGHLHDAGRPTVAITHWNDELELFMEYPIPVAGDPGRFIIYLTILESFQPVRGGAVFLRFHEADGTGHEAVATEPLRDGIFAPTVRLPRGGSYEFELIYRGDDFISSFTIDGFAVHESAETTMGETADSATDETAFLKEQQWKIPFATSEAVVREIKRSVWAIGEVLPSPTAYVEIVAPIDGVVRAGRTADLAMPGSLVRRGEVVATITPPLQGSGWAASQLAFAQAERNLDRARRLREKDAISKREFEEAENEYLARRAGHERLSGSGDGGVLRLTAPIDGKIIDWQVRPGQRLEAGDRLMSIVDPSVVWLKVHVYERDFRNLGTPVGAFVKAGGDSDGWHLTEDEMRVLTAGGALDPITRTIPILLEVSNAAGRLTINESTPVELYASEGASATAVPRSAVYEDDGLDVVFVQTGGESFEKRAIELGPHHAGWTSIREGLRPGERVVTRGGYHVKLASTTVEIGHGHAH